MIGAEVITMIVIEKTDLKFTDGRRKVNGVSWP